MNGRSVEQFEHRTNPPIRFYVRNLRLNGILFLRFCYNLRHAKRSAGEQEQSSLLAMKFMSSEGTMIAV